MIIARMYAAMAHPVAAQYLFTLIDNRVIWGQRIFLVGKLSFKRIA